jgi:hypothetical protein
MNRGPLGGRVGRAGWGENDDWWVMRVCLIACFPREKGQKKKKVGNGKNKT